MPLAAGTRLGPYEITEPIGKGGMGEVYRARDTKLGREVAIKVLPEELAADAERVARFEREAKLLASLNHPNIASIYGFESNALVLELVEGPTLDERIARGPIPNEEAFAIAKQIAEALEAGHEAGVVHRDLKPANVKVKDDGTVKVLDYGLAKALEGDAAGEGDADLSQSPTLTRQGTEAGVILGTAPYMSPEQAKGKRVDKRADIWAFGAVLYEMLTGKRAFAGEGVSDTLAAVLRGEPDLDALPSRTPANVRRALELCLKKDPKKRARDIGDVALALEGAFGVDVSRQDTSSRWVWAVALVSAAAAALIAGVLVSRFVGEPPPARVMRFEIEPGQLGPVPGTFVRITPDGETLVYTKRVNGEAMLFQRTLDMTEARPIAGTEGALFNVFVSPDSQWVGYATVSVVNKVPLDGGAPVTLCDLAGVRGVSWGNGGDIVLGSISGLYRVSSNGGEPELMTKPPPGTSHVRPSHLPNDRGILLTVWPGASGTGEVAVLEPGSREPRVLVPGTSPKYVSSGHVVYQRDGSLWAARFDLGTLEVVGSPVPVIQDVYVSGNGAAQFDIADTGTLIHVPSADAESESSLLWIDREGDVTVALERYDGSLNPRLSPDGRRVAAAPSSGGPLIVFDLERRSRVQLADRVRERIAWSSDGRLAYSNSDGSTLEAMDVDGSGARVETLLARTMEPPHSWSPDGSRIAFERRGDIWIAELGGSAAPLTETPLRETDAAFSPDGSLIAYTANVLGGVGDVVVQDLDTAERWTVSTRPGKLPLWRQDGTELFWAEDRPARLMAVDVRATPSVSFGQPRAVLTEDELGGIFVMSVAGVSPDGERFLILNQGDVLAERLSRGLVITLNWTAELNELAATN